MVAQPKHIDADPDAPGACDPVAQLIIALRAGDPPAGGVELRKANLIDRDLSGLDLSGANLAGANLSRANLTGANLMQADLRGAVLFEARLDDVELAGADLSRANLEHARGERAGFAGANLDGAHLSEARLHHASFTRASLVGAELRCADLRHSRLFEANLAGADLRNADLRDADISYTSATGATFTEADLRGARLTGMSGYESAGWIGVDIRNINFTGAYLVRRHIGDENYLNEFRSRSRGSEIAYRLWWLTSDCGRSITRWSLCVLALVVGFAFAYGAVGIDYGDYETPISALYFSVVTMTTLGYGDVLPADAPAQILAVVEVVIGYVMLGGLLSIFSTKMSRRSE